MFDSMLAGYWKFLLWPASALAAALVGLWAYLFVRDYGYSPVRWFRGWWFAFRKRLLWWQRTPPLFQLDTRLYVGLPGSGKTLLLTRDAIHLMRLGVRVLSNYRIVDPLSGASSLVISSWFEMLAYSVDACARGVPTVFVIDEIHLWAPARMFQKTPGWWLGLMAQRRHYGVGVIGTCQSIKQVESALRRLTDYVIFVRPLVPGQLFGRRLPWFHLEQVPAATLTDEGLPLGRGDRSITLVPWWVYGGYNTAELVAVEEWSEDEDISARIARLTSLAQELTIVDEYEHLDGTVRPVRDAEHASEVVQALLSATDAADGEVAG